MLVVLALVSASLVMRGIVPQPARALAGPGAAITEFPVNIFGSDPLGIAAGADGNLWIADSNDNPQFVNPSSPDVNDHRKVEKMSTSGVVLAGYSVVAGGCCADPSSIVLGPDGAMWFTESTTGANAIGRVPVGGGAVTEFRVPSPASQPTAITSAGGALWFTEAHAGGKIGRITTGGSVSEYPVTLTGATSTAFVPYGITTGPDGNLWFTLQSSDTTPTYVGVMDINGVMLASIKVSNTGVGLAGIAPDAANNAVWFTEQSGHAIGKIDVSTKTITTVVGDGLGGPTSITKGADGLLYFVETLNSSIGRFDPASPPASVSTHFLTPTPRAFSSGAPPTGITVGPDSNIWFTENSPKVEGQSPSAVHAVGRLILPATVALGTFNDFGTVAVNTSSSAQNVAATSMGAADLVFSGTGGGFTLTGPNPGDFSISANSCASARLQNADPASPTCSLNVTFRPADTGARTATLHVTSNAAAGAVDIPLAGTGSGTWPAPSGSANLSTTRVAFGPQTPNTASGPQSITLTNPAGGPLTVSAVSAGGPNAGDFIKTRDTCSGTTVAAGGGTCIVSLVFMPAGLGARSATLTFNDSAPEGHQDVALSGTGQAAPATPPPAPPAGGYWLSATDGGIFNFGNAGFFGSTGAVNLNKPIVGMAATPSGKGYWLVASDGGIFTFGDAVFFGSTGAITLNKPIVGMAATPTGQGYWLVATDGGIFNFGDAAFFGSTGAIKLNKPIVAMASTRSGQGYWLSASDGGIFNFGDAAFAGSTGSIKLNRPIVAMAAAPGGGYWLVATDGGIFNFGTAGFFGSTGAIHLNSPIVGMAATGDGAGYWLVAADGGIFNFGTAGFFGSTGAIHLNSSIVVMAAAP
jgi:streptogramin lyase